MFGKIGCLHSINITGSYLYISISISIYIYMSTHVCFEFPMLHLEVAALCLLPVVLTRYICYRRRTGPRLAAPPFRRNQQHPQDPSPCQAQSLPLRKMLMKHNLENRPQSRIQSRWWRNLATCWWKLVNWSSVAVTGAEQIHCRDFEYICCSPSTFLFLQVSYWWWQHESSKLLSTHVLQATSSCACVCVCVFQLLLIQLENL